MNVERHSQRRSSPFFPMKVQPVDCHTTQLPSTRLEPVKPVVKSRFKRLFERQFLKISTVDKVVGVEEPHSNGPNCSTGLEPASLCLAKMVQNFIEESNEKQPSTAVRCSRNRCNCFNGNCDDSSEDEWDGNFGESNLLLSGEACEFLKNLVSCVSVCERNLLADIATIVDKNKICKLKDDIGLKIVTDGLLALGYDASVCKCRWERCPSYPAGEYDYIDVLVNGDRLLIDVDFRSEFEIARPTKHYKSLLQILPCIFVGKTDRLQKIIAVVSEAAKQSLKKKGMYIPPWRKVDYIKAKWLSPCTRASPSTRTLTFTEIDVPKPENVQSLVPKLTADFVGLKAREKIPVDDSELCESVFNLSPESTVEEEKLTALKESKPLFVAQVKSKSLQSGIKIVTGLASVIGDES
ncbi:hypothetical protein K2173_018308 [Erythroxylum novogranatense]|uniref:DNA-directed RNA polymerase n=1 Tax=Erythroxylum novogranatense TaxID=1862640 RepID=A0AAV8UBC1_9ROSI|nr:hypothetical protein K2173_018308 [Erythroxylum novogranatense]